MKVLCTIAKWFLVGLSAIFVLASIPQIVPILFFVVAIAVMLPPMEPLLISKLPFLKQAVLKFIVWFGLVVLGFGLATSPAEKIAKLEAQKNVTELIAIVQKQDTESQYAAEALGNLGDKKAIDPLIAALTTATDSSDAELRSNAAEALGKFKDPRAVQPLVKSLSDSNTNVKASAKAALKQIAAQNPKIVEQFLPAFKKGDAVAKEALASLGEPAVEPMIAALKEPETRNSAAEVLGKLGDARAIKPLTTYLVDWVDGPAVGAALQRLNWQPETEPDKIHFWVSLRDGKALRENWETTQKVLVGDVQAGNVDKVQYGLYSLISIGDRNVVSTLTDLLKKRGNKTMALGYLNCGEPTLEKAAQDWAKAHGYEVVQTQNTQRSVEWGSW